jgi:hypothetical protein
VVAPSLKDWLEDVREYRPEDVAGDGLVPETSEPVDVCFLELTREEVLEFRALHPRVREMVRPGGHIVVLYRTHGVESLAPRDISFIVGALPVTDLAVVWYRGGRLLSWLQRRWDERLGGIRKRRGVGTVRFVVTALLALPVTWLANHAARRRDGSGELPPGCTSVVMDITVLGPRAGTEDTRWGSGHRS